MRGQPPAWIPARACHVRAIQKRQNRLLAFNQIVTVWPGWHVVGAPEAHRHAVAALLDLGAGQPSGGRLVFHLDRSAAPFLDHAASLERPGDERVPGSGPGRSEQLVGGQPEVKWAD